MPVAPRLSRAIQIRQAALIVLKSEGQYVPEEHPRFRRIWRRRVRLSRETPFGPIEISHTLPTPEFKQHWLTVVREARPAGSNFSVRRNLPFGLDIWRDNKVTNLEWDRSGDVVHLVSFGRRRPWEEVLLEREAESRSSRDPRLTAAGVLSTTRYH